MCIAASLQARDGGFVFATETKGSAGECIEKNLVGCMAAKEYEVAFVTHGTPLFLLNKATNCLVFGVLSCDSEDPALLDPTLGTMSLGLAPGTKSPYPLQVTKANAPFVYTQTPAASTS